MTWSTAVLGYEMFATNVLPTALATAAANVPLFAGEAQLIGFTVASDTIGIEGNRVTRTLTLTLNAQFNANFSPGSDPTAPFQNLYTMTLSKALVAPVVALPPLVT